MVVTADDGSLGMIQRACAAWVAAERGTKKNMWSPPPAFSIEKVELTPPPPGVLELSRVTARVSGMTSTDPTLLFLLSEDARATDLVRLLSKEKVHQPGDGIIGGVDVTPNGPSTLECGVDTTGAKSGAYRVAVVQFRDRGGEIAISDDAFVI